MWPLTLGATPYTCSRMSRFVSQELDYVAADCATPDASQGAVARFGPIFLSAVRYRLALTTQVCDRCPVPLRNPDAQPAPCRIDYSRRTDLRMYANRSVGWRRSDMVRRRTSYSPIRDRCSRNEGWLPSGPSLPRSGSGRRARPSRRSARNAAGAKPHRSYIRPRTNDALSVTWWSWRNPNRGLLQVAEVGRHQLRDAARRRGGAVGQILGGSPLRLSDPWLRSGASRLEGG